ncbi:hypothetical protein RE428_03370 [Marinobacter nanhaiticus D15-8W]|uniref:Thermostable hemolysin n=1 Tax=Marinobacter nanhaiticus D15-8W TaxID=626887 RepID=N6VXJ3_9GAMM|nr:thermostable hemolysin [Marinobacter nanhaiticus]ENO14985.1 hypothetical protein J057_06531 [Marinobacter nanhaiticus D15-8W]BES69319.1 hypothetical protein RE428_03370 [Marinobacter nanhaiticus D15-8W]
MPDSTLYPNISSNPDRTTRSDTRPLLSLAGRRLCEIRPGSAIQEAVVRFIQSRFLEAYGARPSLRVPQLLALLNRQDNVSAAVGVRDARVERLFLEDYLENPIEEALPDDASIDRAGVFEIAHLAGVEPGISRFLFPMLTVWLTEHRARWIAFTGTAQLRNSFDRLGIETHVVGPAKAERLPDRGIGWGRYYEHGPMVMVANVPSGYAALTRVGLLDHIQSLEDGGCYELTA